MTDVDPLKHAIRKLVARLNLSQSEMANAMDLILTGTSSDASTAAFLVALTTKGESPLELGTALDRMRAQAFRITPNIKASLIDTCGTGGDGMATFNISTTAAILASSAGIHVAKHGNRSSTSLCGSADFLEYVGFDLDCGPEKVLDSIESINLGFIYAPKFHPAIQNVVHARKEIGVRTIFNILGPLSNPCTNITGQVIGVYQPLLLESMAVVCKGYLREAMIIHAHDGFDELSNTCPNDVARVSQGTIRRELVLPKSLGITLAKPEQLAVATREEAVGDCLRVLNGEAPREKEDIVLLNAAAALIVANASKDMKEGLDIARSALKSGAGRKKLWALISRCGNTNKLEEAEKRFLAN